MAHSLLPVGEGDGRAGPAVLEEAARRQHGVHQQQIKTMTDPTVDSRPLDTDMSTYRQDPNFRAWTRGGLRKPQYMF